MSSRSSSFPRRAIPAIALGLALAAAWVLWPAGGAGLWAAAPTAATPGAKAGSLAETTEVVAVQVPVQVVRNGEPVRGLTAADFEVYDGRRKQKVTGFEVLDLAGERGPAIAALAPALRRHFLFLFDLSFSEPSSIVKARQMVREMLPALHPSDLVAVASYSSAGGPRLLLGFTSDRRQVSQAIDNLGLAQLVDRNPDPLQLIAAQPDRNSLVTENNQDLARLSERANRQQQQAVVGALTRSFTDLARLLAGIHGRKEVIYLSEGFDTSLLQGSESIADQAQMAEMTVQGQGYLNDSDQRYGDTRGTNMLEKMMEEFRRSDCIIQSIDIGGARTQTAAQSSSGMAALPLTRGSGQASQQGEAPVRRSGEGSLFAMAHDTGGELYHNFNDLGVAMGQLLKKTSVTYVLTFQPDEVKHDGSYHKLRVELKGQAGKGAQVFFRPGYYVPKPYAQQTQKEKILAAADQVVGGSDSGAVRTALLVAPFRQAASALQAAPPAGAVPASAAGDAPDAGNAGDAGKPGGAGSQAASDKAYVPVMIEADGPTLLEGSSGAALPVEIYSYAIDSAGAIQDFFSQSLRLDLAKAAPALRRGGLKFFGHLDLPPGEYNVRVLVRNGATGAYGLRSQPLVVPAFGEPAMVLLQPFFPEAPGRWVMVKEAQRQKQRETPPYPFVIQERAYVPASLPVVPAGQEVAMALVGYHLPAGVFQGRARLLAADGKDLGEGELKLGRRESPDAEGQERLMATFRPPRDVEPGEYQLVIVLTDAQGGAHQTASRFVVPPAAVPAALPPQGSGG
jgi:VWFA-related protein